MLLTIGLIIAGIVALFHLIRYYHNSHNAIWRRLGVPVMDLNKEAGVKWYDILFQRISFIEVDKMVLAAVGDRPFVGYVSLFSPVFHLNDVELIKQVAIKDFDYFSDRKTFEFNKGDKLFGRMLTNIVGQEWKDLRSVMSPTFTTGKIKRMFELFNMAGKGLSDFLHKKHQVSNEFDFQDACSRYTMASISAIAFGQQVDVFEDDSTFRKMAAKINSISTFRLLKFLFWFTAPKFAKALGVSIMEQESTQYFTKIFQRILAERRAENNTSVKRNDFLQLMIEAQKGQLAKVEESELSSFEKEAEIKDAKIKSAAAVLDDTTLLAQTFLFFLGGTDTVESAITMVAYMLAQHEEIQEKLANEVHQVMEQHGDVLSYDALNEMEYLDMVVSESLRINPPAFLTERISTKEYQVPGTNIALPKKTRVLIPIRGIHHNSKYYENPEQFNPENFSATNKQKRHPYAYLPFGLGPRNCIAMRFAIIEVKAAIAHLVNGFKLEPCARTPIPFKQSKKTGILRAENGMPLKFEPRMW